MAKLLVLLALVSLTYGCGVRHQGAAPLCRASQLRVTQGRHAVGLGNLLEEVIFTNVSQRPCLLRGYPTITARVRPVPARRGGTYFGRLHPAVLKPAGKGFLDFGTADLTDCPTGPSTVIYRDPAFTLPNGGRVSGKNVTITEHCSLSMSELGRPEPPR
jgi:Protein of unknown function (DUF4232)